ncbi:MAG: capsid protein [Gemykibivirus abati2]|uniref:capsid protein n=1 Tax=Genomoviridae sp. TaxID=2202565 RepID=UPI00248199B2|nr:MAG: capsid protein [Genomoviridae sp.]QCW23738.1 MAG: capsid protein [Genomoviridae sp.]
MAYSRRRFSRRRPAFRRRSYRRPSRRGVPRRRTTTRRRPMTRRRVNDIASRKMHDDMCSYTDVTGGTASGNFFDGGATYAGGTTAPYVSVFHVSARSGENFDGADYIKAPALSNFRHRTNCYLRGAKEDVLLETNSGASWRWRRIVFSTIGNPLGDTNDPLSANFYRQTALDGYKRLNTLVPNTGDINRLLFRGDFNRDWADVHVATLDTGRVKILRDMKTTIRSGNINGTSTTRKFWYPVNRTMRYDDRQNGNSKDVSVFASEATGNQGDIYIADFFTPNMGSDTSDELEFTPHCAWYWHEK